MAAPALRAAPRSCPCAAELGSLEFCPFSEVSSQENSLIC